MARKAGTPAQIPGQCGMCYKSLPSARPHAIPYSAKRLIVHHPSNKVLRTATNTLGVVAALSY